MPNIYFTADTHFGHDRIIQYANRPFSCHEEMDEILIERLNSVLKRGDVLYHLGDVAWSSFRIKEDFLARLNTKEVHLILGNHDIPERMKLCPFRTISEIKRIAWAKRGITLCHYAMRAWRGKGSGTWQLYGHSHAKLPGIGLQMDVGVDTNNFFPWAWEEIEEYMKDRPIYPEKGEDNDNDLRET